jgi:hypothetical protein
MPLPFRNNPKVVTNWHNSETNKNMIGVVKRAYYDISTTVKKGWLVVKFREQKKRLGGSAEREEFWFGQLEFELDTNLAKDLKMFLNEYVEGNAPEVAKNEEIDTQVTKSDEIS